MSASAQTVTVDGRATQIIQAGQARSPALVLVHAFPVGLHLFDPQLDAFGDWRVIAPALPGFDGSELLESPEVDAYARHLVRVLDELRVAHAVFGGVSLGGYVILGVIRQAPHRVAGIILADTRSAADTEETRAARQRMLQLLNAAGPTGVAADMIPKLLGRSTQDSRPEIVASVRRMIEGQTSEGIAAAVRVLMSRPDSTPLLPQIRKPALVIVGQEDVLTPPAEMEQMAMALPQSRYVEIPQAGHLSNLENPGPFNAEVRAFLASLR